ncbi:MAG TPA: hypothetical protein VG713_12035 [Pirellulales bacterium]|nr:hypothetical protein [Pirellulales bacterium]
MTHWSRTWMVGFSLVASSAFAAEAEKLEAPAATYKLRYKFQSGETLRWEVEHRAEVRTTVGGTTQTAETNTTSVKVWKVSEITPDGDAKFVYSVDSVDMRQKLTGRQEVRYNSKTDKEPPVGFQDAAKSVGVPLTTFVMSPTGKIVTRSEHLDRSANQSSHPSIPLPEDAVPLGHKWSFDYEVTATARDRAIKKVQMRQQMTLDEVKNGIAIISVNTQILTPVRNDPTIEAQLVQSESEGKIRFDIDAGRMVSLQSDLDKHVVGFQGEASSLHCVTRFAEKLMPGELKAAAKPATVAGPQPPKTSAPAAIAKPAPKAPAATTRRPPARRTR